MEFHQLLSKYAWRGDDCALIGREKLGERHKSLLRDCGSASAIAGGKAHAYALYGGTPDQPYWGNNHRRRCGLGPMPLRAVLRYRRWVRV